METLAPSYVSHRPRAANFPLHPDIDRSGGLQGHRGGVRRQIERNTSGNPVVHDKKSPLIKLTVALLDTYKGINSRYYARKGRRQKKTNAQIDSGKVKSGQVKSRKKDPSDYLPRTGDLLNRHWFVEETLGKGCFGVVVLARYYPTGKTAAIKVVKSKHAFFVQSQTEIKILNRIKSRKHMFGADFVVQLRDHFMHNNHQCLVFDVLGLNLYRVLKDGRFKGLPLERVQKIGKQIAAALSFLKSAKIINADLKPENILFVPGTDARIKVIDFGSSCLTSEKMYAYIQSRFYRAPEVLLGKPYSCEIDMWSFGCILAELHTGRALFPGVSEEDQVYKLAHVLGLPGRSYFHNAKKKYTFFVAELLAEGWDYKLLVPKARNKGSSGPREGASISRDELRHFICPLEQKLHKVVPERKYGDADELHFVDLVASILTWDPADRITPDQALKHGFFATTPFPVDAVDKHIAGKPDIPGGGTEPTGHLPSLPPANHRPTTDQETRSVGGVAPAPPLAPLLGGVPVHHRSHLPPPNFHTAAIGRPIAKHIPPYGTLHGYPVVAAGSVVTAPHHGPTSAGPPAVAAIPSDLPDLSGVTAGAPRICRAGSGILPPPPIHQVRASLNSSGASSLSDRSSSGGNWSGDPPPSRGKGYAEESMTKISSRAPLYQHPAPGGLHQPPDRLLMSTLGRPPHEVTPGLYSHLAGVDRYPHHLMFPFSNESVMPPNRNWHNMPLAKHVA